MGRSNPCLVAGEGVAGAVTAKEQRHFFSYWTPFIHITLIARAACSIASPVLVSLREQCFLTLSDFLKLFLFPACSC